MSEKLYLFDVSYGEGFSIPVIETEAARQEEKVADVWIVLVEDRHADVEVLPFSTEEAAITEARAQVAANARHPERIEWDQGLTSGQIGHGCVFFVNYSSEGDRVSVVRRTVDQGQP